MNDAKRLKKYLAVLGAFVFLGLGGCGQKQTAEADSSAQATTEQTAKKETKSSSTMKIKKNGPSSQGKCNPRSTSKRAKPKR